MIKLLQKINRNLIIAIPSVMIVGFATGLTVAPSFLKDLIPFFTFLMIFPMMVTLQYRKVFEKCAYRTQGVTQLLNLVVIPLVGFVVSRIFFSHNPYMALGLMLVAVIPTSGMTISWTSFAGGNVEAAVKMMVIGITLGSVLAPVYVHLLLGAVIDVNMVEVFRKILMIVFLPMAAGFLTRRILLWRLGQAGFRDKVQPTLPSLATVGVLGIVFAAMALRAGTIASHPLILVRILLPLTIFYLSVSFISRFAGRKMNSREDAVALYFGTALRNLSIALAMAVNAFGQGGSDAALVIVVAFVIQTQMAAWSAQFVDRITGTVFSSA